MRLLLSISPAEHWWENAPIQKAINCQISLNEVLSFKGSFLSHAACFFFFFFCAYMSYCPPITSFDGQLGICIELIFRFYVSPFLQLFCFWDSLLKYLAAQPALASVVNHLDLTSLQSCEGWWKPLRKNSQEFTS